MKKYYSVVSILAASAFTLGMSSPSEEALVVKESHKSHQSASGYTKPHAGIDLKYKRPKNLQVGESLELDLSFKVSAQAEQLWVVVNATDGLQLNSVNQYEFDASKQKKHKLSLQVDALQEGRMRLNVNATMLVDGRKQSRSFSIPVTVGDPANFKSDATTAPGYTVDKAHGVVSMPAMESSE